MKLLRSFVLVTCALFAGSAFAYYGNATPPAGWSGTPGAWKYAPSSPSAWAEAGAKAEATIARAAQSSKFTASLRLTPAASRFAAAAIFANPTLRAAFGIATWATAAAILWDDANQRWAYKDAGNMETSDGFKYRGQDGSIYSSPSGCSAALSKYYSYLGAMSIINVRQNYGDGYVICVGDIKYPNGQVSPGNTTVLDKIPNGECPYGWYITPAGCTQFPPLKPLTDKEFEERIQTTPMPESVPRELPPGTPLPVEIPQFDPMNIPTGLPYPNPNKSTDPAHPYVQPYENIRPAQSDEAPWRVDISPQLQPVPTPEPVKNPPIPDPKAPTPTPDPTPTPTPTPDPTPQPPQPDLCEKYPDINACQKPKPEEEDKFEDTALGDVPKLYTQKYPDGLSGVWRTRSAELKSSALFSVLGNLMPQIAGGGSPPQIIVSLDVGIRDFGTADLSPPLYVWQFGGLVIVISALLLARALVFGG